ncbi:hypothetical protein WEI85_13785 [Actinomycetes bacterium KLBMP 9797]
MNDTDGADGTAGAGDAGDTGADGVDGARDAGGAGLFRCVDQMLNPDTPWWPTAPDPWG